MGVTFTTTGGLPRQVVDEQAMQQIAIVAHSAISQRTFDRGRGQNDKAHKPYSKAYAATRKRRKEQVSPVNLTVTGKMRRSFRPLWVRRDEVRLGLTGNAAVYGRFVGDLRPWMRLSKRDIKIIRPSVRRILVAAIHRSVAPI